MAKKTFVSEILVLMLVFGMTLIGCTSINAALNPITAIDVDGNKVTTGLGMNNKIKLDDVYYSVLPRPAVPAAPKAPVEPKKPTPPPTVQRPSGFVPSRPVAPSRPTEPSFDAWYSRNYPGLNSVSQGAGTAALQRAEAQEQFRNSTEYGNYLAAKQRYQLAYQEYQADIADYNNYQQALAAYNNYQAKVERYNSDLAKYQNSVAVYQQEYAKYEQASKEYTAKLPGYQAEVDAKCKAIQDSINSDAPNNWVQYIDGKYLLYRGKI